MIHGNFLTPEQRRDLTILARRPKVEHRVARRANALVLLDRGMSCEEVAAVLLLDDDTVRTWFGLFEQTGVKGISDFKGGGSIGQLTEAQRAELKAWVAKCDGASLVAGLKDSSMAKYGESTQFVTCVYPYAGGFQVNVWHRFTVQNGNLGASLARSVVGDSSQFIPRTIESIVSGIRAAGFDPREVDSY